MLKKVLRLIIVVLLMIGIVVFWFQLDTFGIDPTTQFYLVGGGVSLLAIGALYKMLGSWDLIPDWIPILGSLDDALAWFIMLIGLAMASVGWFLF